MSENINDYLSNLLNSQKLSEKQNDNLIGHRDELEKYLREEFGSNPVIRFGGSKAKHTMITECYDLDVICYFPNDDERSLKEIRQDVQSHIELKYAIESRSSAIRILDLKDANAPSEYHIDVVPGRFIDTNKGDAFLHVKYGEKERMQTNIDVHIKTISESGCRDIIKLAKLWNVRNGILIRTFVLEIFTINSLKEFKDKDDLEKSLVKLFQEMSDKFEKCQIIDPANSANDVSKSIHSSIKSAAAKKAKEAVDLFENDKNKANAWKQVFCDSGKAAESNAISAPSILTSVQKPWCNK